MRVIALDYGRARTGVAISDPTGTLARPLGVVERVRTPAGMDELIRLIDDAEAELVVVGLPLTLAGETGAQASETLDFVRELRERCGTPVETEDERFTTSLARSDGRSRPAGRRGRRGAPARGVPPTARRIVVIAALVAAVAGVWFGVKALFPDSSKPAADPHGAGDHGQDPARARTRRAIGSILERRGRGRGRRPLPQLRQGPGRGSGLQGRHLPVPRGHRTTT